MTKKKKQNEEITEESVENQESQSDKSSDYQQDKDKKEEDKPLSSEELLSLEKDKNLRLFAEFENFRKRTAKERIELFSSANKDIMTTLLPIMDNFERSIKANNIRIRKERAKRDGKPNRQRTRYRFS